MVLVIYGLVSWISFMEMIDDKNVQAKSNDEIFYSSLYIKKFKICTKIPLSISILRIALHREMNNFFTFSALFTKIILFSSSNIIPKKFFLLGN